MPGEAGPGPSGSSSSEAARRGGDRKRGAEREVDLVTRMRFSNSLPDIPFDPKFLQCPFLDLQRFVPYKTTSLEKNYKYEVLTEPDLGVEIDLIDPETYTIDPQILANLQADPLDEFILEDEVAPKANARRSAQHNKVVPWMRKTEYISSEYNRFGTQTERQETKVGYNIKKRFKEENIYRNRQEQLDAIERSFADAAREVRSHHSKPGILPVAELPVLPDFRLWRYPFAQVIFDSDPAPANTDPVVATVKMRQALIRGMMDESGEQFVAYFLPSDETLDKRRREEDGAEEGSEEAAKEDGAEETLDYRLTREYNWTVKNKASKGYEENYLFVMRPDSVTYNELETRVRLSRRRAKEGAPKTANSRLVLTQRPPNEDETAAQEERMLQLAPPQEEEEEEEEEAEEAGEAEASTEPAAADEPPAKQPRMEEEAKEEVEGEDDDASD